MIWSANNIEWIKELLWNAGICDAWYYVRSIQCEPNFQLLIGKKLLYLRKEQNRMVVWRFYAPVLESLYCVPSEHTMSADRLRRRPNIPNIKPTLCQRLVLAVWYFLFYV